MDHRLNKLVAIVENKSFTAAARQLHVSQPALTAAIQQLEREFGTTLLVRHKRQFSLTPAGQAVYAGAVRMRNEFNAMRTQVREDTLSQPGVRIGMLDTVAILMIDLFKTRLAGRQVEVMVDNSARLINDVRFGRLDLAIIVAQDVPLPEGMHYQSLPSEQFFFVSTPTVAASTDSRRIMNWLAFNPDSTTYVSFTRAFARAGIQVHPIFYSTSMELLKELCLQGLGVALLPRQMVRAELDRGDLAMLDDVIWSRDLWLITGGDSNDALVAEIVGYIEAALNNGETSSAPMQA